MRKLSIFFIIIEILIAILLRENIEGLVLYSFIILYINGIFWHNNLRRMIRVYQVANEVKLLTIMKKLKINKKDTLEVFEEIQDDLSEKQKKSLNKDVQDLLKLSEINPHSK